MKKHILWLLALVMILGSVRSFAESSLGEATDVEGKLAASIPIMIESNITDAFAIKSDLEEKQNDIGVNTTDSGGALKMLGDMIFRLELDIAELKKLHIAAQDAVDKGQNDRAFEIQEESASLVNRIYEIRA
jgi:hypothetical protein